MSKAVAKYAQRKIDKAVENRVEETIEKIKGKLFKVVKRRGKLGTSVQRIPLAVYKKRGGMYSKQKKNRNKNPTKFMDPRNKMKFHNVNYNEPIHRVISDTAYYRELKQMWYNPFSVKRGVRLAWEGSIPTAVVTLTSRKIMTMDGAGNLIFVMLPSMNYNNFWKSGTSTSWNPFVQGPQMFPDGYETMTLVDSYRCIAMGIKVRCVDTMSSSKGLITTAVNNTDPWYTPFVNNTNTWQITNTAAGLFETPGRKTFDITKEVTQVWHPQIANEFDFEAPRTLNYMTWDAYHSQIDITMHSCNISQAFEIETVAHFEWLPTKVKANIFDMQTASGSMKTTQKLIDRMREDTDSRGHLRYVQNTATRLAMLENKIENLSKDEVTDDVADELPPKPSRSASRK
jgi:hypothetical protein